MEQGAGNSQGAGSSQGAMHGVSMPIVLAEPQPAPADPNNIEAALPPLPPNQSEILNMKEGRKAITHLVLNNEHAFRVVGSEGFRQWCRLLQPQFIVPSRRTIARDCYQLYLTEKLKLKTFLKTDSIGRITLTKACWTSMQNLSYLVIVAYSIDNDGNYRKRIICFTLISNQKEDTIESKVEKVLRGWGISNVSTVASESAFSMDDKLLDTYRNSSSPRMAEVLICTQSWLKPSLVDSKDLKLVQNMSIRAGTSWASGSGTDGGAPPATGPTV